MNVLFSIKFTELLAKAKLDTVYSESTLNHFNKDLEIPEFNAKRYPLLSPQIHHLFKEYKHHRIRLVIYDDHPVTTACIEIYSVDYKLIKFIPYRRWDFVTSLTIESELNGLITGVTQL